MIGILNPKYSRSQLIDYILTSLSGSDMGKKYSHPYFLPWHAIPPLPSWVWTNYHSTQLGCSGLVYQGRHVHPHSFTCKTYHLNGSEIFFLKPCTGNKFVIIKYHMNQIFKKVLHLIHGNFKTFLQRLIKWQLSPSFHLSKEYYDGGEVWV